MIALTIDLGFASITTPKKIVIPIEDGQFGIFKYRQHPTDPLSVENIAFDYAGKKQVTVKMRVTGQLKVDHLPDIRIAGTKVDVKAGIEIENKTLSIYDVKITRLDFPNIPSFADKLLGNLFSNVLLKNLKDKLKIDLSESLEKAKQKINAPIPINLSVSQKKYGYEVHLDGEPELPELTVSPNGIHIKIRMTLKPKILMV